jgi:hypothetical protein
MSIDFDSPRWKMFTCLMRQARQGYEVRGGTMCQMGDRRVIIPNDGIPAAGHVRQQLANQPAAKEWAARRAMVSGQDE